MICALYAGNDRPGRGLSRRCPGHKRYWRAMTSYAETARLGVLRTFEWLDGDALLTPVFQDADVLASLGPGLAEPFQDAEATAVVAPEAHGFVLGSLCAVSLGVGFVAARKPGAPRPGDRVEVTSEPDWRGRRITFQVSRVFGPSDRILLVDDWIETGSQASAIAAAIVQMGATLLGTSVIVDQAPETIRSALDVVGLAKAGPCRCARSERPRRRHGPARVSRWCPALPLQRPPTARPVQG